MKGSPWDWSDFNGATFDIGFMIQHSGAGGGSSTANVQRIRLVVDYDDNGIGGISIDSDLYWFEEDGIDFDDFEDYAIHRGATFNPAEDDATYGWTGINLYEPHVYTFYAVCEEDPTCFIPVSFTILPKPFMHDKFDTICNRGTVDFDFIGDTVPAGTYFTWTYDIIDGVPGDVTGMVDCPSHPPHSLNLLKDILINTTNETRTVVYYITPTWRHHAAHCHGDEFTLTITVYPDVLTGEISSEGEIICEGETPMQIGSIQPGSGGDGEIKYRWRRNGAIISGADGETYTPPAIDASVSGVTYIYAREVKNICQDWTPSAGSWVLTVFPHISVTLISATGTDAQAVRAFKPITDIRYASIGATSASLIWSPSDPVGIDFTFAANVVTISGIPTIPGIYTYTVTFASGCEEKNATGTLIVRLPCPDSVIHQNGEIYYSVELAGRCWYRENLRDAEYEDGSGIIPFAKPYYHPLHPDIDYNLEQFGRLYTYQDVFPNRGGGHPMCYEGWSLPTSEEWSLLIPFHPDVLRTAGFWLTPNSHTNATDFSARGAGFYNSTSKRFEDLLGYTAFWAADSTDPGTVTALGAVLRYHCSRLEILDILKGHAISVRCIMDEEY
jgi:uncharacterized protein (TIGR02145 family)